MTTATATANKLVSKLQKFVDGLDVNQPSIEIDTGIRTKGVIWLRFKAIGIDRVRQIAVGLDSQSIKVIKQSICEFVSTLD